MTDSDRLLAALDNAPTDSVRRALIAAAPREQLLDLNVQLMRRQMEAELAQQNARYDELTRELDSAPDDAERLKIIEAAKVDPDRGSAWLAEWHFRRTASTDMWIDRYMALIQRPGATGAT